MKILMIMILIMVAIVTAIESGLSAPGTVKQSEASNQVKQRSEERKFMQEVSQSNLFEIKAGKLALQKGKDIAVKELANEMTIDHDKAQQDLNAVASKLKIPIASKLDKKHQEKYNALSTANTGFDQLYVKEMVIGHKQAVRTLMTESIKGKGELREYAVTYLPKVKQHYSQFEKLQAKISNNSSLSR